MKKLLILVAVLMFAVGAFAQDDHPKATIFAGYSYLNADTNGATDRLSFHGWNASVTGNFNSWLGLMADFGGYYGSPDVFGVDVSTRTHSFLFGPQIGYTKGAISPSVHALFGGIHQSAEALGASAAETAFAMGFGGAIDAKAGGLGIRLIQFDYLPSHFSDAWQHNIRLSFGLTFNF